MLKNLLIVMLLTAPADAAPSWNWFNKAEMPQNSEKERPKVSELELVDIYVTSKPFVTLSDISVCKGDRIICDETHGALIVPLIKPDEIKQMSAVEIEKTVREEWSHVTFRMSGAKSLTIKTSAVEIEEEGIRKAIAEKLLALNETLQNSRLTLSSLAMPSNKRIFPREYNVEIVDFIPHGMNPPFNEDFLFRTITGARRIKCLLSDREYPESGFLFEVKAEFAYFHKALFSQKPLMPGDKLTGNNTYSDWLQIKIRSSDSPLTSLAIAEDMVVARSIAANAPLTLGKLKRPSLLKRGQQAELRWRESNVNISSSVQVLQDGRLGDTISVMLPYNKKIVQAKVLDATTVEAEN